MIWLAYWYWFSVHNWFVPNTVSRISVCFVDMEVKVLMHKETLITHKGTEKLSSWWRHQTETFSALLDLCAGNSRVTGGFPSQRPVKRSFDVFFDLRINKRLSKQSWGWWFETPSRSPWRHCNGGPCADWNYDVQTKAISPVYSCPERSFHATDTVPENTGSVAGPRRHCTTYNPFEIGLGLGLGLGLGDTGRDRWGHCARGCGCLGQVSSQLPLEDVGWGSLRHGGGKEVPLRDGAVDEGVLQLSCPPWLGFEFVAVLLPCSGVTVF